MLLQMSSLRSDLTLKENPWRKHFKELKKTVVPHINKSGDLDDAHVLH